MTIRNEREIQKVEKTIKQIIKKLSEASVVSNYETTPAKNKDYFKRINDIDNQVKIIQEIIKKSTNLISKICDESLVSSLLKRLNRNLPVEDELIKRFEFYGLKASLEYDRFYIENYILHIKNFQKLQLFRYDYSPVSYLLNKKTNYLLDWILFELSKVIREVGRDDDRPSYVDIYRVLTTNKLGSRKLNISKDKKMSLSSYTFISDYFESDISHNIGKTSEQVFASRIKSKVTKIKKEELPSYLNLINS